MLVQIEAGNQRVTGLDDRETDECFETEFTARTNPHRGYITIIEGCDKFCAYCVVPFTRGKERSRTSDSVLAEARQMADLGYTEIQLLGQIVNSYKDPAGKKSFAELAGRGRGGVRNPPSAVHYVASPRFRRATSSTPSIAFQPCATTFICRFRADRRGCSTPCSGSTPASSIWSVSRGSRRQREISITTDIIVGFPGETEAEFEQTLTLLDEVEYDAVFGFKYSPRPNTPSLESAGCNPG